VKYGQELLDALERELQQTRAQNNERRNRVFDGEVELNDCFVSGWSGDLSQRLVQEKIEILKAGGVAEFEELCFIDGTPANAKPVNTRYGFKYLVDKEDGSQDWVDPYVKEKTLARKGYKIAFVPKPAWAAIKSSGTGRGLAGAMNCYVNVFPSDRNYWTGEEAV